MFCFNLTLKMKQGVLFLKLHIFYCGGLLLNLNLLLSNQGLTLENKKSVVSDLCPIHYQQFIQMYEKKLKIC